MKKELFAVIVRNDFESLEKMIEDDSKSIIQEVNRDNLFSVCMSANFWDGLKLLIKAGANINRVDEQNKTPLHYLCENNNDVEMIKFFIKNGAGINSEDKFGNKPLWVAVFNAKGKYDIVEYLLKNGADPNSKNKNNKSPLDFATQINDTKLIELLKGGSVAK